MGLFDKIKSLFIKKKNIQQDKDNDVKVTLIPEAPKQNSQTLENLVAQPIHNKVSFVGDDHTYIEDVWEHLSPLENTQAHHLISVVGFNEWIDMENIRKRITEMYFIEYKNEKSLYPYIKTLVDIGLLETNSVGGKRKWRKKELVIKIRPTLKQEIKIRDKLRN